MSQNQANNKQVGMAIFIAAIFFLLSSVGAKAADVSITFGSGFPISQDNMAPGQIIEREFVVTNNTSDAKSLMIRLDDQAGIWHVGSFDIEEMMLVKIRKPDGSFANMPGNVTSKTLEEIYELDQAFVFDDLSGPVGNSKKYVLMFTFDPDAGNEYQNKKTVFDVSVGIDAVDAVNKNNDNDDDDDNDESDGRKKNRRNGNDDDDDNNVPVVFASARFGQSVFAAGGPDEDGASQPEVKGEEIKNTDKDESQPEAPNVKNWWYYPSWLLVIALLSRVGYIYLRKIKA